MESVDRCEKEPESTSQSVLPSQRLIKISFEMNLDVKLHWHVTLRLYTTLNDFNVCGQERVGWPPLGQFIGALAKWAEHRSLYGIMTELSLC